MGKETNYNLWWLELVSYLFEWNKPRGIAGCMLLAATAYSGLWLANESTGTVGSKELAFEMAAMAATIVGAAVLAAKLFRWPILYRAVKLYSQEHLLTEIKENTVLVGEGAGGALAVGMLSKALQELNHWVPRSIVVDCEYTDRPYPQVAHLLPATYRIPADDILIVASNAGTGGSIRALKEQLGLEKAKVFCFIVQEELIGREKIDHYLHVGSRSILPWPRTEQQIKQNVEVHINRTIMDDEWRKQKYLSSSKYHCPPVNDQVISDVFRLGSSPIGIGVEHPDEVLLKRRFAKNPNIIWAIYERETGMIAGYYIVYPLNPEGKLLIEQKQIKNAKDISDEHLSENFESASCIYLGMLCGRTEDARAYVLYRLISDLNHFTNLYPNIEKFFARPATKDGLRIIRKYSFNPIDDSTEIWSLTKRLALILHKQEANPVYLDT